MQLKAEWRTERIAQLERQLAEAIAANASLTTEVETLRARVAELEAAQQTAAEEIMSYVESMLDRLGGIWKDIYSRACYVATLIWSEGAK